MRQGKAFLIIRLRIVVLPSEGDLIFAGGDKFQRAVLFFGKQGSKFFKRPPVG